MFSVSITPSSTTTPSATARPPSVMVFTVPPSRSSTTTAVSSASGIERKAIRTVRTSRRNTNSTTAISRAPMTRSSPMPPSAEEMKFAGRCSPASTVTPCALSAEASSRSAASTACVASSVLAPYWLDMETSTPGLPMISASPVIGPAPSTTSATSPIRTGAAPLTAARGAAARSEALRGWPCASTRMRCSGVSMKPAPLTPVAAFTAASTSATPRSRAARWRGRTRTSSRRTSPPYTVARATPGTESRRGRTVHCTSSRS